MALEKELATLRLEVDRLRAENDALRAQLSLPARPANGEDTSTVGAQQFGVARLTKDEIERYSRQCFLDDFRPEGTAKLIHSRVLIVGAGGLGSSSAMYLAAAGVGYIRIVDHDRVERSNLHRQIIHPDYRCGEFKAESAKLTLQQLNPLIRVDAVVDSIRLDNCYRLTEGIDLVVDATDNVASRYLINDICVARGIPLVSGSAMRWEGQLTVYGPTAPKGRLLPPQTTSTTSPSLEKEASTVACYRCLFPKPPPPVTVGSCNDSGVIGALPGVIGCLQALEAQKVLIGTGEVLSGRMLHLSGLTSGFRVIKLRPRRTDCPSCGEHPALTLEFFRQAGTIPVGVEASPYVNGIHGEYVPAATCGRPRAVNGEIKCDEFQRRFYTEPTASSTAMEGPSDSMLLLDVRVPVQYELCALPDSVNIPKDSIVRDIADLLTRLKQRPDTGPTATAPRPSPLEQLQIGSSLMELESALADSDVGVDGTDRVNNKALRKRARVNVEKLAEGEAPHVFAVCRRGIASVQVAEAIASLQEAVKAGEQGYLDPVHKQLRERIPNILRCTVRNVVGGLNKWAESVDPTFPNY